MFSRRSSQAASEKATEFATRADFQKIFTEDMAGLHLLALLLTADQAQAEQCFVAGLEDSIHGNPVFRQWARSWSKRAIIKNAIKTVAPAPGNSGNGFAGHGVDDAQTGSAKADALVAAVTRLEPFKRFVFVMSVLEGYSVQECSLLLGCVPQEVTAAKSEVLQLVGKFRCTGEELPAKFRFLCPKLMATAEVA